MKSLSLIVFLITILTFAAKFGFPNPDPTAHTEGTGIVIGEVALRADQFLLRDSGFSGVVLISHHGRPLLHKGYGWIERERSNRFSLSRPACNRLQSL